jgi:hypothetical protein
MLVRSAKGDYEFVDFRETAPDRRWKHPRCFCTYPRMPPLEPSLGNQRTHNHPLPMYHSGIGGGGFMLVRSAKGDYEFVDFRETAPAAGSILVVFVHILECRRWSRLSEINELIITLCRSHEVSEHI